MTTISAFAPAPQHTPFAQQATPQRARTIDGPSVALAIGAVASIGFSFVATIVLALVF